MEYSDFGTVPRQTASTVGDFLIPSSIRGQASTGVAGDREFVGIVQKSSAASAISLVRTYSRDAVARIVRLSISGVVKSLETARKVRSLNNER